MDPKEIIEHLRDLLNRPDLNPGQKKALETVINEYHPGLSTEQIIKLVEMMISILFMTHQ